MRLFPHPPDPQIRATLSGFKEKLFSAIGPVLAIAGLILSAIPDWARILACTYLGCLIFVTFLKSNHQSSLRPIELNDGDVIRVQEAFTLSLIKLRHWGWAGSWGLDLACYGSRKKIHFLASHCPPAALRRIARQRIHGLKQEADTNSVVQTPVARQLWL